MNDAIKRLGMKNEFRYRSSFNRPNLAYEVRKKDSKTIDVLAEYIANRRHESGVIYCLSRKDCETVCDKLQQKLREKGCPDVGVSYYHAELDPLDRQRRHHDWSSGKLSVLCATIAFGMGIDKPDVRYVIHFSMPKSITHYYQESGRAGRDGDKADCILFFAYKDKKVLEMMIRKASTNPHCPAVKRKIDQLYTCLRYCENEFLCRRTMQLEYFGEVFDRAKCKGTCDNCRAGRQPEKRDLTKEAQTILRLYADVAAQKNGHKVLLANIIELYKGSKSKSATRFLNTSKLTGYGAGKKYTKQDIDRIIHAMIFEGVLMEISEQNNSGYNSDYLHLGDKAAMIEGGRMKFFVDFPKKNPPKSKEKKSKKNEDALSTPGSSSSTRKTTKIKDSKTISRMAAPFVSQNGKFYDPDMNDFEGSTTDDNNDLGLEIFARKVGSKSPSPASSSFLPKEHAEALMKRIKKLVTMWADEERMNGNNVFCECQLLLRMPLKKAPKISLDNASFNLLHQTGIS